MVKLITGTAGFIGNSLAYSLLRRDDTVIGVDNVNDYYDQKLKHSRLIRIKKYDSYIDNKVDLENLHN